MARHHRINSDLAGLKSVKSLKKEANHELEECGRVNRTFSNYQSIFSAKNKDVKHSKKLNTTATKKIDLHELITDTYRLLKHFYGNDHSGYYERVRKYLKSQWQGQKKHINEHLNKLGYLENSMHKKTYPEIERELITEWRKSPLLYSLRAFWYQIMLALIIRDVHEFLKHYHLFRDFAAQVAYLVFRGFFSALEKNGTLNIVDKLTDRTVHFIITSTNTWVKLCHKMLFPLFQKKFETIPKSYRLLRKFNLETLEIKKSVVNDLYSDSKPALTLEKIQKFLLQYHFYDKIELLNDIRSCMEEEIKVNQEKMISAGKMKKFDLLDKDDFISYLIYCIVKGEVDFEQLGMHVKYFHYLLGKQASEILSKFSCDSYLTDLEAVHDYLHQWAIEFKSLNEVEVSEPSTPTLINYSTQGKTIRGSGKTADTKDASDYKSVQNSPLLFQKSSLDSPLIQNKKDSFDEIGQGSQSNSSSHCYKSLKSIDEVNYLSMPECMSAKQPRTLKHIQQENPSKQNQFNSLNYISHHRNSPQDSSNCETTVYPHKKTVAKKLFHAESLPAN